MSIETTNRRRFLVAVIAGSAAMASGLNLALIRNAYAWADQTGDGAATIGNILARMVHLYYPHENVAGQVYEQTADDILTAAASDSQLRQLLDDAYAALDEAGGKPFAELDPHAQLAAMTKVQDELFFTAIKFQVLARFYANAEVWKAINYPGSSVEHGGYVERGFNDIDWLPVDAK